MKFIVICILLLAAANGWAARECGGVVARTLIALHLRQRPPVVTQAQRNAHVIADLKRANAHFDLKWTPFLQNFTLSQLRSRGQPIRLDAALADVGGGDLYFYYFPGHLHNQQTASVLVSLTHFAPRDQQRRVLEELEKWLGRRPSRIYSSRASEIIRPIQALSHQRNYRAPRQGLNEVVLDQFHLISGERVNEVRINGDSDESTLTALHELVEVWLRAGLLNVGASRQMALSGER